jgi:hypothetical protein
VLDRSRGNHVPITGLSTDDFPTRCSFYTFPNWPEEPAFSRRWPRFGESVQPAAGSSPTVIRCEPTSDVPVAVAPSIRHAALDCGWAPRRSSCESGLVSRVCIRRSSVKKTGLEQTRTSSIAWCLFSTRSSSAPCRAAGASKNHHPRPAVTISLLSTLAGALAIRNPARFRPRVFSFAAFCPPTFTVRRRSKRSES